MIRTLVLAAAVGQLVAWVGAVLNTAQLEDKTWFLVLLVSGLLSVGFVAMIAYLVAGPDDPRPWLDADRLRLLLREIFTSAGGSHDDWDEYDRVMAEQRRTAVLISPTRIYSN